MWRWVLASVLTERTSVLASAAGVSLALLLAIVVEGVFAGEAAQIVRYLEEARADVWVAQKGVSNMHMATSFLTDAHVDEIAEVDGVARADSILYVNAFLEAGEDAWFAYFVGGGEGAWDVAAGWGVPGRGEVVVPDVIARRSEIELGDTVQLAGRPLEVVGLSEGTYSMANPVVFVHRDDVTALLDAVGVVSYVLVQTDPSLKPEAVARRIEDAVEGVHAMGREEFIANDRAMAMHMGADVIALMSAVGSIVAALLLAFTVYADTLRRRRQLAVTLAMGATVGQVLFGVLFFALIVTGLGCVGATVLALGLGPVLRSLLPEVTLLFAPSLLGRMVLLSVGVAVVSALPVAWRVAHTDPAEAFAA